MLHFVVELIGFDDRLNMGPTEKNEGVKNDSKVFDLTKQKNVVAIYSIALLSHIWYF